jgi:membrane-bound lytic murein transglycosylase A
MRNSDPLRRLGFSLFLGLAVGLVPSLNSTATRAERPTHSASGTITETQSPTGQPVPLRLVNPESVSPMGPDDRLWASPSDRAALIAAIDHSLTYLQTEAAAEAYRAYPLADFSLERVQRSLTRFRQLVLTSHTPTALQAAVQREFAFYQSVGTDDQGNVHFTGYFEPVHQASLHPTAEFRYPIYGLPPDLKQWPMPHPTRAELEGSNGLQGSQGRLRGLEIAWLRNRLEAYLVQVQGSARLRLTDGSTLSVGYAGRTDYPYVSIGRELVEAGKIPASELTLNAVTHYFEQHPTELDTYLPRNNRFVFFRETSGSPAIGSLRVPVTAGRSIATDKSLMPPGALALIRTDLPSPTGTTSPTTRFVLDQDTGGAIRGPGRVDLFVGTGAAAGEQAGLINQDGQLYYLLLKE